MHCEVVAQCGMLVSSVAGVDAEELEPVRGCKLYQNSTPLRYAMQPFVSVGSLAVQSD